MGLINRYIKWLNKKFMMTIGLFNILLSIVIVIFSIHDILDINLFTREFYFVLILSFALSIMVFFFLDLFYTCIVSIIIILFDRMFDLKYLSIINYMFISQILFLNTLALLITLKWQTSTWLYLLIFLLYIPLIYIYYQTLKEKAHVAQKSAMFLCMLLSILLIIPGIFNFK